jgi:uncharacterized membrane protein YgaE (UPF0421/DUF939 family)
MFHADGTLMETAPFFTREYVERLKLAAKTGLAAIASLYFARLLRMPESYWAAISAIIVMYSDVGKTVSASWRRLIGTAIGVSIGGAFAAVFGPRIWAFGVAVTLTMLVCALLGFAEAARLAGVAVAIVMLISHPGAPWVTPLHRFLEVSFGIVIAVLVSVLIWPSKKPNRA